MRSPIRRPGDDMETEARTEPGAIARTAARLRPKLNWTDSKGSHSVVLDGTQTIGSADGVGVVVADRSVSRLHAEIKLKDDGVWVRDLGSRNGTYIDGVRVIEARLAAGSTLQLGAAKLSLREDGKPTAIELWPEVRFGPLIGRSVAMRELFARLARIAPLDSTVLIQGETGTGKELVARALHENSPRAAQPFIIVDCGSLTENLLEAELFGHTRGAFTGAVAAREGAIEAAEGGTVFLDEIGEMPLSMQPKLLRVLESRTVRRLGENTHRKIDTRFIAATHRDLRSMANAKSFREDLYFRLAVVPVDVPPLREHPDDIQALISHFLPANARNALSPEQIDEAAKRAWIGNVRELRNFVERAVALGAHEALAMPSAAHPESTDAAHGGAPAIAFERPFKAIRDEWIDRLERDYLRGMLERHQRNVPAISAEAGLDRTYIYRLIRRHGL